MLTWLPEYPCLPRLPDHHPHGDLGQMLPTGLASRLGYTFYITQCFELLTLTNVTGLFAFPYLLFVHIPSHGACVNLLTSARSFGEAGLIALETYPRVRDHVSFHL